MTSSTPPDQRWYWGRCASNKAMLALFDVTHMQKDAGRFERIESPRAIFPKKGQAEIFGIETKSVAVGEFYRFQVKPQNRPGSQVPTRIIAKRKALPFYDAAVAIDVTPPTSLKVFSKGGECIIRTSDDTIVRMPVTTASQVPNVDEIHHLENIVVHRFDPSSLIAIAGESGAVQFYDAELGDAVRTTSWMSDAAYVSAGLRAAIREGHADASHLEELLQWIDQTASALNGKISVLGDDDPALHEEILRTGRLAATLRREKSIIGDYLTAMRSDPAVGAIMARAAQEIADSQREGILESIRAEAATVIQAQAEAERTDLFAKISREAIELETEMMERIEKTETERVSSLEAQCAEREKASKDAIDAMASEVKRLGQETHDLSRLKLSIEVDLEDLRVRRSGAIIDLQRLTEISTHSTKREDGSLRTPVPIILPPAASVAKVLHSREWRDHVAQAPCLNAAGKTMLERFSTLLLAGEVPILHGGSAEDFLAIAATLITGGRRVALDPDPTVITTDDIWIRPCGNIRTAFGQVLLALEDDQESGPVLGIIRQAERSGMRFWLPGLSGVAIDGIAGRRFLPCAHVADVKSDEAEAAVQGHYIFHVEDDVLGGQESLAVATGAFEAARCVLVLDDAQEGTANVLGLIGAMGIRSLMIATRLRRIASIATQIMSPEAADMFLRDLAKFFIDARHGAIR